MSSPFRFRPTANVQSYKASLIGKDGKRRVVNCKPVFNSSTASHSRRSTTVHSALERSLGGSRSTEKNLRKSSKRTANQKSPIQSPKGSTHNTAAISSSRKEDKSEDLPQITTTFLDETYRDLRGRFNRLRAQRSNCSAAESFCEHVEGCSGIGCSCPRGTEKITSTKIGGTNCDYVQETIIERSMMTENGVQTTTKHIIKRCDKSGRVEVEVEESKHVSGKNKSHTSDATFDIPSTSQPQESKTQASEFHKDSQAESHNIAEENRDTNAQSDNPRTHGSAVNTKSSSNHNFDNQSKPSLPPLNPSRRGGYIQINHEENLNMPPMPVMPPTFTTPRDSRPTFDTTNHSPLDCSPCLCKICANYICQKLSLPLNRLDQQTLNSLVVRRPQDGRPTLDYFRLGEILQSRAVELSAAQERISQTEPPTRRAQKNRAGGIMEKRDNSNGTAGPPRKKKYLVTSNRKAPNASPSKGSKSQSDVTQNPQKFPTQRKDSCDNLEDARAQQRKASLQMAKRTSSKKSNGRTSNSSPPATNICPIIAIPVEALIDSRKRCQSLCDIFNPICRFANDSPSKTPFLNEPVGNDCGRCSSDSSNSSTCKCDCHEQYSQKYEPLDMHMLPEPSRKNGYFDLRHQIEAPHAQENDYYIEQGYNGRHNEASTWRQPPFQPIIRDMQPVYPVNGRQDYTSTEDHMAQSHYAEIDRAYSRKKDYNRICSTEESCSPYPRSLGRYPDYPSRFSNRSHDDSDGRSFPAEQRSKYPDFTDLSIAPFRNLQNQSAVGKNCGCKRPSCECKIDNHNFESRRIPETVDQDNHIISSGMPSLTEERLKAENGFRADDYRNDDYGANDYIVELIRQPSESRNMDISAAISRDTSFKSSPKTENNDRPSKCDRPSQTGECSNMQRPRKVSQLHRSLQHMQLLVNTEYIKGITKGLQKPADCISHTGNDFVASSADIPNETKFSDGSTLITQTKIKDAPTSGGVVTAEIIIPTPLVKISRTADQQAPIASLVETSSITDQQVPTETAAEAENDIIFTASVRSVPGMEKDNETIIVSSQIEVKPKQKSITFQEDEDQPQLPGTNQFGSPMTESQLGGQTPIDEPEETTPKDFRLEKASIPPDKTPTNTESKSRKNDRSNLTDTDPARQLEPKKLQKDAADDDQKRIEPRQRSSVYTSNPSPDGPSSSKQSTLPFAPTASASFTEPTITTSPIAPTAAPAPKTFIAPTGDQQGYRAQQEQQAQSQHLQQDTVRQSENRITADGSRPAFSAQQRHYSYVAPEDLIANKVSSSQAEGQEYTSAEEPNVYEPRIFDAQHFDLGRSRPIYEDSIKPEYNPREDLRAYNMQTARPPEIEQARSMYAPSGSHMPYNGPKGTQSAQEGYAATDRYAGRPYGSRQIEPTRSMYAPIQDSTVHDGFRKKDQTAQRYQPPRQVAPPEDYRLYDEQQRIQQEPPNYPPQVFSRPHGARSVLPERPEYAPSEDYRTYNETQRYPPPYISREDERQRRAGQIPQLYPPSDYPAPRYAPIEDPRIYKRQRSIDQGPQSYRTMDLRRSSYVPAQASRAYFDQRNFESKGQGYADFERNMRPQLYADPGEKTFYQNQNTDMYKQNYEQAPTSNWQTAASSRSRDRRASVEFKSDDESEKPMQEKLEQEPKTTTADSKRFKSRKKARDYKEPDKEGKMKRKHYDHEETESESQSYSSSNSKAADKNLKSDESTESDSQDYSTEKEEKKSNSKETDKSTESEESTESESEDYSSEEIKPKESKKEPRNASVASTSSAKVAPVQRKSFGSTRKSSLSRVRFSQMNRSKIPVIFCYEPPPQCSRPCRDTVLCDPCYRPCDPRPCRRPCAPHSSPCRPSVPICQPAHCHPAVRKPTVGPPSAKRPSARSSKAKKPSKLKKRSKNKKSK